MTITLNGTTGITTPAETVTGTDVWSVGSTQIYKNTSGSVGIGTATPDALLHVYQTGGKVATFGNNVNNNGTYVVLAGSSSNKNWAIANNMIAGGALEFVQTSATGGTTIGATSAMSIDSSGNLIMASRSGAGNTRQLQVGTTASSGSANAYGVFIADSSSPYPLGVKGLSSSQGMVGFFDSSDGTIGSISKSGSSVAYNTSSDYRLKENIAPMTGALATVAQLKPCTYTWKVDGSSGQGFIAHELAEVVPDCVTGEKDAVENYTDEDGNEQTRIKPQGVDTSFLVATLTAAIQELKAELDTVKTELATLKGTA